MTYDELIELARNGDPLVDPDEPDSISVTDDGLVILGKTGDEVGSTRALDLRIRIEDGGLRAWVRDPAEAVGDDVFLGREWSFETFFNHYDDLVSWVYAW